MAEIITKTVVELEQLGVYHELNKAYIDAGLAKKWESATFDEATRKVSFYTVPQPSGDVEPVFTFTLPEVDFTEIYNTIDAVEEKVNKNTEDITGLRTDVDAINNVETGILKQAKDYADEKVSELANGAVKENADAIDALEKTVNKLDGADTVEGSVKAQIKAAKEELTGNIATTQDELNELEEKVDSMYTNEQIDDFVADAKKAGTDAQDAVNALAGKVGEVPEDKTVAQMIADAKTDILENKEAIALLNDGAEVEGSVDYKIAQAVASIMENPDETMNSINELVTWINNHAEDALELSNKVTANEEDIAALEELVGTTGVAQQITDAINAALKVEGVDKYALATDLTAAIARIVNLESKAHEHANKEVLDGITAEKVTAWDSAEINAKAHATALDEAMDARVDVVETAIGEDGFVTTAIADAKQAGIDASAAVTALEEGQVATNTQAIADNAAAIAAIRYATPEQIQALWTE